MEPSGMTFKSVQNLTQAASAGAYKVRIEATGPQGQKKQQAVQFP
jgi:fructose-specific phosphotransferase system component IIB